MHYLACYGKSEPQARMVRDYNGAQREMLYLPLNTPSSVLYLHTSKGGALSDTKERND